jgi:hypothetical protein
MEPRGLGQRIHCKTSGQALSLTVSSALGPRHPPRFPRRYGLHRSVILHTEKAPRNHRRLCFFAVKVQSSRKDFFFVPIPVLSTTTCQIQVSIIRRHRNSARQSFIFRSNRTIGRSAIDFGPQFCCPFPENLAWSLFVSVEGVHAQQCQT